MKRISFLFLFLLYCQTTGDKNELQKKFQLAIKDAEIAEISEVSDRLIAISPRNKSLSWKKIGNQNYLKMLTWTSWNGYDSEVGKEFLNTRETWVTVFPELRNFCKNLKYPSEELLTIRLEQLLGLPTKGDKTKFVEVWVKETDLFRPSPDPEIDDSKAELDFSKTVSKDHINWINKLKKNSYGLNGYPWTRLGYTFDWGNPNSKIGLSEFVIKQNSNIIIDSVTHTYEYCK